MRPLTPLYIFLSLSFPLSHAARRFFTGNRFLHDLKKGARHGDDEAADAEAGGSAAGHDAGAASSPCRQPGSSLQTASAKAGRSARAAVQQLRNLHARSDVFAEFEAVRHAHRARVVEKRGAIAFDAAGRGRRQEALKVQDQGDDASTVGSDGSLGDEDLPPSAAELIAMAGGPRDWRPKGQQAVRLGQGGRGGGGDSVAGEGGGGIDGEGDEGEDGGAGGALGRDALEQLAVELSASLSVVGGGGGGRARAHHPQAVADVKVVVAAAEAASRDAVAAGLHLRRPVEPGDEGAPSDDDDDAAAAGDWGGGSLVSDDNEANDTEAGEGGAFLTQNGGLGSGGGGGDSGDCGGGGGGGGASRIGGDSAAGSRGGSRGGSKGGSRRGLRGPPGEELVMVEELARVVHGGGLQPSGSQLLPGVQLGSHAARSLFQPSLDFSTVSTFGHGFGGGGGGRSPLDSPGSPGAPAWARSSSPGGGDGGGGGSRRTTAEPSASKARVVARAALAVGEALRRRNLDVALAFEGDYLAAWHRAASDMFLVVSGDGAPRFVTVDDAERVLLATATLGAEEAAAWVGRTAVLRKRRQQASMRAASVAWIGTKEALPASMVQPEYLRREDVDGPGVTALANTLLPPELPAEPAQATATENDKSREGGGGKPAFYSPKKAGKPLTAANKKAALEEENARQNTFEAKKYPSLALEVARK